jgi:hypothetical protein
MSNLINSPVPLQDDALYVPEEIPTTFAIRCMCVDPHNPNQVYECLTCPHCFIFEAPAKPSATIN